MKKTGQNNCPGKMKKIDSHGWVDYVENAAGNRTTFSYDSATGRIISQTDALTNTSYSSYTSHGQLEKTWGSGTYPVLYEYDGYDRMATMSTYRGGSGWDQATWPESPGTADTTTWGYQEATGLLTNKTDAAGKSVTYTYSAGGKLATRTWSRQDGTNALVTTYSYSTNGDLTGISYSDSTPAVSFTVDRLGRQITADSSVSAHTFAYNGLLLDTETIVREGITNIIDRSYDGLGRSIGFTMGDDYSVSYGYDSLGRFSSISSSVPSALSVVYSYLTNADLIAGYSESSSGLSVTRSYEDHRNLMTQIVNSLGTNVISQFDYQNDAAGRRTQRIDSLVKTNSFGYNSRSELVEANMDTNVYGYVYDPIGNRIVATNNAEVLQYTANNLNQYTQITNGGLRTLSFDPDGNLTNDGTWAYAWDGENRLTAATNETTVAGYAYDYMSRRSQKIVNGVTNNFVWDGWHLVQELITDNGSLITNLYTWGLDLSGSLQGAGGIGGLLSVTCVTSNGAAIYYPCYDANGNISDYVDTNGTVVAHREYDAFGNTIVATGPMVNDFSFWFSTKYLDQETGLYYYGYRYYDPVTGRWMSEDPLGETGGVCLYVFCKNNILNKVDAFGLYDSPPGRGGQVNIFSAIALIWFGFDSDPWAVDFLNWYISGNGQTKPLSNEQVKMIKSAPEIINVWLYPKTMKAYSEKRAQEIKDDKLDRPYLITTLGVGHNSLASFTVVLQGKVFCEGNGWKFDGEFQVQDQYDFDTHDPSLPSDRSEAGKYKVAIADFLFEGHRYLVRSDWIHVTQRFLEDKGTW